MYSIPQQSYRFGHHTGDTGYQMQTPSTVKQMVRQAFDIQEYYRGDGIAGLGDLGAGSSNTAAYTGMAVSYGTQAAGNILQGGSIVQTSAELAGAAVGTAAAMGAGWATAAIPFVGPAIAAFTIGLGFWLKNGKQKLAASKIVDAMEPKMKENLAAYMNGPRTVSSRQQALNNFDAMWGAIVDACGKVGGGGGERCVTDRQTGACTWKDSSGKCWNWFIGYRDPIANDVPVDDPVVLAEQAGNVIGNTISSLFGSNTQTGTSSSSPLLLLLIGGGLLFFGMGK